MMRGISVIFSHYDRCNLLRRTLDSYRYHYASNISNIEIVCVDDTPLNEECFTILDSSGFRYKYKSVDRSSNTYRNPGVLYNLGVDMASHDVIHLTNPENIHVGPVFKHANKTLLNHYDYIVYGCRNIHRTEDPINTVIENIENYMNYSEANGWYQHSRINNRLLHFGSVTTKWAFAKIGGFHPIYDGGIGYEDNDFAERIYSDPSIMVSIIDEPSLAHQFHSRGHWGDGGRGLQINSTIFSSIWRKGESKF